MLIVGIELGYEFCGLASVESETLRLRNHMQIETPRAPDLTGRLRLVHDAIAEQLRFAHTIEAVGYQNFLRNSDGKSRSNASTVILQRVLGHLESICWQRGIRIELVEPQEIKKALTGAGSVGVDDVHRAACAYAGTSIRAMTEFESNATATALTLAQRLKKIARGYRVNA